MYGCDKISCVYGTVVVMRDIMEVLYDYGRDIWREKSDNCVMKQLVLRLFEHYTDVSSYTKWIDEASRGVCVFMCIMLKRGDILIIIGHCLIVLRGDAQKPTINRLHYSRWVGNKKRAQEKQSTYGFQYKDRLDERTLKRILIFTAYNPYWNIKESNQLRN